jgi:hypothetical protein
MFYDAFAKKSCRYSPVSFIMAVHPSICPQTKLDHRTDFYKMDRLTDQQKCGTYRTFELRALASAAYFMSATHLI